MITFSANAARLLAVLLTLAPLAARADLYTLAASGTISSNTSGDSTIPLDTPWTFELTYNTVAPDLDFELTGSPDPTFGRFTNTGSPPALIFFHYQAGIYEVTMDDPADFGAFSDIHITFTVVNAIDINIRDSDFFPTLAGGPVSFHADFNAFSTAPVFTSDALPTNTALSLASFDQSTVTLLPPAGVVSSSSLTSLTLTALLPGDFDGDGDVDGRDFLVWERDPNVGDLADWQENYGAGSLAAVAVPEPASLLLIAILTTFVVRRAVMA